MAGELEDLPEIMDQQDPIDDMSDDDEDLEPEQTLGELLTELVQNILHKTSSVAIKAMKDIEQMVSAGENLNELIESANKLMETIREKCHGHFDFVSATSNHLINFLLCRFEEERANMKKAAICTLQAVFLQLRDPSIVNVCAERLALKCRDLALVIRKQAALTLTRLLQSAPQFERLHSTWLNAVMHLIEDREESVQKHAAKLIAELIIDPIGRNCESDALIWSLLADIEKQADLRRLLFRTLNLLHKEKCLSKQLDKILLHRAKTLPEVSNLCWMILSELCIFHEISANDAIDYWTNGILNLNEPNRLIGYMAKLITKKSDSFTFKQINSLKINISSELMSYRVHPTYISVVYMMYARLLKGIGGPAAIGHKSLEKFNQKFYYKSLHELERIMYEEQEQRETPVDTNQNNSKQDSNEAERHTPVANILCSPQRNGTNIGSAFSCNSQSNSSTVYSIFSGTTSELIERLIRVITSIGECIQYTPALINRDLFKKLQVIIASDMLQRVHQEFSDQGTTIANTALATPVFSRVMSPNTSFHTELPGIPGGMSIAPSVALSQIGASPARSVNTVPGGYQASEPYQIRIKNNDGTKRVFRTELMTRHVRARAVLTLGQLCLQDEELAKKCIPVFVRQLKENTDHFVRNNIMVVTCDLCVRYTSMVDRYSTILASCLRDHSVLIRRQTLMLLTNLIKEEYLKWEGPIITRYVTTLLDTDEHIKEYAHFCMTDILLPHFHERIFFHHFVECMFSFNGVKHALWISIDDELNVEVDKQCSLEGRHKFEQRMQLYKYMLNTFEDQQKISILEKIGIEIFVPIVEGGMRLSDIKVRNLLFDAYKIMSTAEIKLKMQLGKLDVNYEGDDDEPPELVKTAAKKFISTTFRKTIAETVMPHLFSINAFLTEKRSPLAKHCYDVILEMCRDHEEQLDDILTTDPRLRAEIRFDLKRSQTNSQNKRKTTESVNTDTRPTSRASTIGGR